MAWNLNPLPHEFQPDIDARATPAEIDKAIAATRAERIQNGLDPDTGKFPEDSHDAQLERLADMQAVFAIARKYGGARVQNWIRNYERGA